MDVSVKNHPTSISTTAHLSDDCLHLIFEKLDSKIDQKSFGLTCHNFLNIQNSSRKSLKLGCLRLFLYCPHHAESFIIHRLLNRFTRLESLSLGHCFEIRDSDLTPLLKHGSELHYLFLNFCCGVTYVGLSYVASGCKLLTEVNLGRCENITDHGIRLLNQNCRQLRSLNIYGCDKVTGVSFYGFSSTLACLEANSCAFDSTGVGGILSGGGLEYLNLHHLQERIEGNGLEAIGLGLASNLKVLNFYMCNFVEDAAIIEISRGCPLLLEWNLSYCEKIGIAGWESIGLHCNNLERLHVIGCKNLCDSGLLALGNGCKHLSVIYINNYQQITPSGFLNFKKQKSGVEISYKFIWNILPSWAFTTYKKNHLKRN
ncbi:hypothetical protein CTI12_AA610520 [Artemisia annua]|uniref:Leucine-rich repeat domain, L domain-like protein n=1 Tax=Artemisia annua TaxID=35608 RepID=A0A2U1KEW4_ARTAN|nr:hypothetical protein CTI12_AA610520 [Artemisia annua]